MANRILSLDVLRGFALFGLVIVNAPFFAAPLVSVANPTYGPLAVDGAALWSWAIPHVFFEYKSVALFTMLFGVSLYLVGGESGDPARSPVLRRRLGWLALFGLLHGALVWFGDILLSYAIAGAIILGARSWPVSRLLSVGTALVLLSAALLAALVLWQSGLPPAELAAMKAMAWSPTASQHADQLAAFRSDLASTQLANAGLWAELQVQILVLLTPRTAGLMMIGLALFRTGFLSGEATNRTYLRFIAVGALALAGLAWNGFGIIAADFPMIRTQGWGNLVSSLLSPFVALAYAAGLILLLRSARLRPLTSALAATGRMAFTNYITQSLVLSMLFWSGRGLGLYGELSRPAVIAIAAGLFAVQVGCSVLWLKRFGKGPLEVLWRRLSGDPAIPARATWHEPPLAIESCGLTKRYGRQVAVQDVSLTVPVGATYGFLGPNGAGKTTTIRMLLGLVRPSEGAVAIFGHDVQRDRMKAARQVGALLEARATYDHLSGRSNLDMTRRLLKLPASEVDRVLALVRLDHAAHRRVGHYSLGMRQRLGLARALLGRPRLLILDEPLNGLDPEGIAEMRETIRALPETAGITVFLSSHLLSEVEQVASHIGLMRAGRLVAQGPLAEFRQLAAPDLILRTSDMRRTSELLGSQPLRFETVREGLRLVGSGTDSKAARVARLVAGAGIEIYELTPQRTDLEQLYNRFAAGEAA
ncbi:DUF418 domain-containing protein [Erythrobacter donghaensis]|jgi:uncharacterized membrane protein YeiB/ABC-type multidrug transport system ATPase subunit|uniref:DUF418 domain-containing protein n=1 Tax=Erythrobacter donghaensis TaxID=267135 RepID=UPI0009BF0F64|nr:DUF418 domain-containing protein [Erythrobacter donghaensis]